MVNSLCRATEEEPNLFRPPNSYVPEMLPRLEYQQSATAEEPNMVKHLGSYVPEMQPRLEYQTGQTFYTPQIAAVEEPTMVKHIGSYVPEIQPRLEYQTGQTLYRPQSTLSQIPNDSFSNLPPSFTTLLSGCFPNSTLGNPHYDLACSSLKCIAFFIHLVNNFIPMKLGIDAGQTTIKQDPELKSQILVQHNNSSFVSFTKLSLSLTTHQYSSNDFLWFFWDSNLFVLTEVHGRFFISRFVFPPTLAHFPFQNLHSSLLHFIDFKNVYM